MTDRKLLLSMQKSQRSAAVPRGYVDYQDKRFTIKTDDCSRTI